MRCEHLEKYRDNSNEDKLQGKAFAEDARIMELGWIPWRHGSYVTSLEMVWDVIVGNIAITEITTKNRENHIQDMRGRKICTVWRNIWNRLWVTTHEAHRCKYAWWPTVCDIDWKKLDCYLLRLGLHPANSAISSMKGSQSTWMVCLLVCTYLLCKTASFAWMSFFMAVGEGSFTSPWDRYNVCIIWNCFSLAYPFIGVTF